MARIRSVHPDICQSATMAALSANLERTFVRLWTHCDDEGRCEDRPRIIKAALYPEHDSMTWQVIHDELSQLEAYGLIQRYVYEGKGFIQVRSWEEYQHPQRAAKSKFPPPPDSNQEGSRSPRVEDPEPSGTGEGEGEGDGEKELGEGGADATPPRKRKSKVPDDYRPPDRLVDWARTQYPQLDPFRETVKFSDYHLSRGTLMQDWNAAWRTWIRKADDYRVRNMAAENGQKPRDAVGIKPKVASLDEVLD